MNTASFKLVSRLAPSLLEMWHRACESGSKPIVNLVVELAAMRPRNLVFRVTSASNGDDSTLWILQLERPADEIYPDVLMATREYMLAYDGSRGTGTLQPL